MNGYATSIESRPQPLSNATPQDATLVSKRRLSRIGHSETDPLEIYPHSTAVSKLQSDTRASLDVNALLAIRPQLKLISRKRDLLLQLEFRIEDVHAKLARARQSLQKEVGKGDTLAQWDVKSAEDDLYASVTGGIGPADSDISLEDRLLAHAAAPPPSALRGKSCASDRLTEEQYGNLAFGSTTGEHVLATTAEAADTVDRGSLRVSSRSPSLSSRNPLGQRRGSPAAKRALAREKYTANEVLFCGMGFPQEDLYRYIREGSRNQSFLAVMELVDIRRNDLKAALGFDLSKINAKMTLTDRLQKDVVTGVAQKLTNIRLPTIHTRQFISLWGRDMSQNAALELSRTVCYGEHEFELLVEQKKNWPIMRIVQDVKNLEVPLSQTPGPDQPDIAVGFTKLVLDSSSIDVQPSGT
ncbi:hypothetical protein OHC33_010574 [Knufia fluminis]|uniref:Uncharacterized protein n=1 Tax=Knufia fluminis TaxID=191047 RepID=A0AAN8E9G3_9EURO|nr:hypothetical protein OHC33_010574 [Knufia fluminis]